MRKTKIFVYCDMCGQVTDMRYKLALGIVPDAYEGDERGDDVQWIAPNVFARDYCEECLSKILYGRTGEENSGPEETVEVEKEPAGEPDVAQEEPERSEVFAGATDIDAAKIPEDDSDKWETLYHIIDNLRREKWAFGKIAETLTYKYDFAVTGDEVRRRYQAMTKARKAV